MLHVIPAIAPVYGGPSVAVLEMCRALRQQGHTTLIATTDAAGADRLPVELGRPVPYDGVDALFFRRQWSEAFKFSYSLGAWLRQNVAAFHLVHIHAVFSHSSVAAARACRKQSVPYVVRPLGSLDPWSLGRKRLRKRLLWHWSVRDMIRGAAAVHYTTGAEQRLAERAIGPTRGAVVPLGFDPYLRDEHVPSDSPLWLSALGDRKYVLVLSRLHPKKGLELFLEVFLDLTARPELGHWRLVLAGDGPPRYVADLQQRAIQGGDRILFPGWLDGAAKAAALRRASLLALPSQQENFGICVVEAMACGVPVLVSTHVNLADDIRAAGAGWITELDRSELLRVLRAALEDGPERTARGRAGQRLAIDRFTWSAVADQLDRLYRGVLATPGTPWT